MYYKLDNKDIEMILKISEITTTDFGVEDNFIPVDNIMSLLEELLIHYESLEEKYIDIKESY